LGRFDALGGFVRNSHAGAQRSVKQRAERPAAFFGTAHFCRLRNFATRVTLCDARPRDGALFGPKRSAVPTHGTQSGTFAQARLAACSLRSLSLTSQKGKA